VKAIRRGADSLAEVKAATGAATRCGGCEPTVCRLLEQHAGVSVMVGGGLSIGPA
jgi:NAD(P)H-nitrite reductase large subunit